MNIFIIIFIVLVFNYQNVLSRRQDSPPDLPPIPSSQQLPNQRTINEPLPQLPQLPPLPNGADICTDDQGSPGLCNFQRYDDDVPSLPSLPQPPSLPPPPPPSLPQLPSLPPPQPPPPNNPGIGSPTIPSISQPPSNYWPTHLPTVNDGCGYSTIIPKRIVGGEPAKLGAWPWMALLGYTNDLGEIFWGCGGSLITTRHVLTAAHCLKSILTTVRIGEHDLSDEHETQIMDIQIVKVARHPNYDRKDSTNDLAILYLEFNVQLSSRVNQICLPISEPQRSEDYVGISAFIAGWGKTQEGGQSSNILQQLQLPILKNLVCKERYADVGKLLSEKQFSNVVLCAGFLKGGQDSCQGDSGGPLMKTALLETHAIFYQIGVVSYGIGCARENVPGVYTNVQTFIDWIQQKLLEPPEE